MRLGIMLAFVGLLNLVLLVPCLQADVIPTRVAKKKDVSDRAVVQKRLMSLGISAASATDRVTKMTDNVAAHYAKRPESIQVVGGLHAEEIVLGSLFIAGMGALVSGVLSNR